MRTVTAAIEIQASQNFLFDCFLEHQHLAGWWGVQNSLVETKPGGVWALAWEMSDAGVKYISSGMIETCRSPHKLFISRLVYISPHRPILGPMQLHVKTEAKQNTCMVSVEQSGYQNGSHWDWYYEAVKNAWPYALTLLKNYAEAFEHNSRQG